MRKAVLLLTGAMVFGVLLATANGRSAGRRAADSHVAERVPSGVRGNARWLIARSRTLNKEANI